MNLLVAMLKNALHDLLKAKGIKGARVLDKENSRGEIVVAIVLPKNDSSIPQAPGDNG
jgi:hypothetical protein